MKSTFILALLAMLIVSTVAIGCATSKVQNVPPPTGGANPPADSGAQVEQQFDNSLPADATGSATSDLDSLDSDLVIQ
jgi:hypothetical protein